MGRTSFWLWQIGSNMDQPTDRFDRIAHAEATGRWWEMPWWDEPDCDVLFRIPVDAVRRGAAVLRGYFDDAWYRELAARPRENMIFTKLCLERWTFVAE